MLWQAFGRFGGIGNSPASPGALWTPDNLGSDLKAWWDPAVGVTIGGGFITSWIDKNTSKNLDNHGTSPTRNATGLNSRPTIEFRTNDRMTADYVHTGTQFMLVTAMEYLNSGDPFGRYFSFSNTAFSHDYDQDGAWQMSRDTSTVNIGANRNGGFGVASPGYGTWFIVMAVFDGVDCRLYINGAVAGMTLANTAAFNTTDLGICHSINTLPSNDNGEGDFGDILTMHRAPTTTERQKLEGWFAHKYALTGSLDGGHPYKSSPPTV